MVWIYGGAYRFGSSGMTGYDGGPLAGGGVVVVTFNRRVGVEGYAYLVMPAAAAVALGAEMRARWTAFARDGDPGWHRFGVLDLITARA